MGVDLLFLAISIIFKVIAFLLTPKPKPPAAPTIEKWDIPNAEQGQIIPRVYGTVWHNAPIVAWYGDLAEYPIKQKTGKK